jgi:hypothetical protein
MELPTRKLIHTFGALADLGQEISDSGNFEEMVLTSLHLLLGALGIRRGAVAEFQAADGLLKFVAVRGLTDALPGSIAVGEETRAALLRIGLSAVELDKLDPEDSELQPLLAACRRLPGTGVQLCVPMVVHSDDRSGAAR